MVLFSLILRRHLTLIGTLRSETRQEVNFQRRHDAHAQAVALVSPRRVENVGFACLTFCTKREYICSCA